MGLQCILLVEHKHNRPHTLHYCIWLLDQLLLYLQFVIYSRSSLQTQPIEAKLECTA